MIMFLGMAACAGHPRQEKNAEETGPPVKVKVETAQVREGRQIYRASGTVRSLMQAPLASKVMATILEIRVRPGDRVKTGQLLATLDSREVEAMLRKSQAGLEEVQLAGEEVEQGLAAAQAHLDLANATLKRFQELIEKKSVSPQEFDEVQARQKAAAAQVEAMQAKKRQVLAKSEQVKSDMGAAQALRSYAEIRSPLNGVVAMRQAEPGSLAVPGMPLLTVEETGRYRLEVPVEESRINQIKPGQKVRVLVNSAAEGTLQGTVGEIQPGADPASRTYLVKINLPALEKVKTGMYGEALFETGNRQGLWLSGSSVVKQGQLEGVFVVDMENHARLRLLKLGEVAANEVEVLSGLEAGESYVVEGMVAVKDGSRVEVLR
jgi:RND family efflux transporter MFP subunit